jgi:hypothetical protein
MLAFERQVDHICISPVASDIVRLAIESGASGHSLEAGDHEIVHEVNPRTNLKTWLALGADFASAQISGDEIGPIVMRADPLPSVPLERIIPDDRLAGCRNHHDASRFLPKPGCSLYRRICPRLLLLFPMETKERQANTRTVSDWKNNRHKIATNYTRAALRKLPQRA